MARLVVGTLRDWVRAVHSSADLLIARSVIEEEEWGATLALVTDGAQKPRAGYITVGLKASLTRSFDASAVASFADLAGDDNPVHLDAAYAAGTRFKRCLCRRWPIRPDERSTSGDLDHRRKRYLR